MAAGPLAEQRQQVRHVLELVVGVIASQPLDVLLVDIAAMVGCTVKYEKLLF